MPALRLGISGCGRRGLDVVRAVRCHTHCEVAALHDPDAEALERLGREAGIDLRFAEFDAMLASGIDFVVLCNPCGDRLAQVEAAAAQGVHCCLHAPMAPDSATAKAMQQFCDRGSVKLGVAVPWQADPLLEQLRRMVADDWIGAPIALHAMCGDDRVLRSPPAAGHWLRDPARSGDNTLVQLAAGLLHVAVWLCERQPVEAVALGSSGFTRLAQDGAAAAVKFRGGALCTFAATHLSRGERLSIHGTDGSVSFDEERTIVCGRKDFFGDCFAYSDAGRDVVVPRRRDADPQTAHFELHGRFARWIDDLDDFPCPGDQAVVDMRALDAMQRAIVTGRRETVTP